MKDNTIKVEFEDGKNIVFKWKIENGLLSMKSESDEQAFRFKKKH